MAAVLTQMVSGLIEVDADKAAQAYIEEMPQLAKAQNTGMKPGEIHRSSRAVDNPLGASGTLKSSDVFEMTEADAATGKRVFVNTTSYDMASMKDFMQSMTKKLMAAAGNSVKPEQIDSLVKSMVLTLDDRAVFEVEDGMTRKITGKIRHHGACDGTQSAKDRGKDHHGDARAVKRKSPLGSVARAASGRPAAGKGDELAPLHSISSSARPSSDSGMESPNAFAVLRLMASSTVVDCCTGKSAGLSPFRMRPV